MEKQYQRFPKRWALRVVSQIIRVAEDVDPGDPDWYDAVELFGDRYRRKEQRHADLEEIAAQAHRLLDSIAVLR